MMSHKPLLAFVSIDKDAIDLVRQSGRYDIVGVFDKNSGADTSGLPYLGKDEQWPQIKLTYQELQIAMVVDPPPLKRKLVELYGAKNLATIVSPEAYVASSVKIGRGCFIQRGVTILPDVQFGIACKVNINSTVHHDCSIGDYCTLAPGSQLLGSVVIEDEVFIGAGAILLQNVKVGTGATVGAGAVVTSDVLSDSIVVGVPARSVKQGHSS